MPSWVIKEPQNVALASAGDFRELDVRLTAGRLSVVGTDGPARVEVSRMAKTPLHVDLDDGVLTVAHEEVMTWPGPFAPLWWWINGTGSGRLVASAIGGSISLLRRPVDVNFGADGS